MFIFTFSKYLYVYQIFMGFNWSGTTQIKNLINENNNNNISENSEIIYI